MRVLVVLILLMIAAVPLIAEEGVVIPWEEFKSLYRESIEREITNKLAQPVPAPQVYSIDEARYRVELDRAGARVEALISGRVLSGTPQPIPLFGKDSVVTVVEQATGGSVTSCEDGRMAFLPEATQTGFQVVVQFLVEAKDDNGARAVKLDIPPALQNALELTTAADMSVIEAPGILDAQGARHFAACSNLTIRYADTKQVEAATAVEMAHVIELDSVSRITLQGDRLFIASYFLPTRALPDTLVLTAPRGAKYISSSLRPSSLSRLENDRYELRVPSDPKGIFSIEFVLENVNEGSFSLTLPTIEGNNGRQGRFVVEEPEDGQVTVTAEELVSQIPVERLGEALVPAIATSRYFMSIPPNGTITLTPRRFEQVATPTTVLASQQFFASFDENGTVLSVLVMAVPPEVGPRLKLKAVPGAEIWSLKVNKAGKKVYAGEEGAWMIPLDSGQTSLVELAFLQQGPKLGLQGRLEAVMPETGLPSQEVLVGVALPPRVDLLSVEGPVSPGKGQQCELPAEFVGKPYWFGRSFHKGEGLTLAISYKEPVNSRQQ